MRLWLTKNTDVPMREQITTQVALGVACGDLKAGEKLPSRQQIVQKFSIHANTVSIAYQELAEQGIVEFRAGSGFFVADVEGARAQINLPQIAFEILNQSGVDEDRGLKAAKAYKNFAASGCGESLLVVENDRGLREIIVHEIKQATGKRVFGISFDELENEGKNIESYLIALSDERANIEPAFENTGNECLFIRTASISESLSQETRPSNDALIAIVSGWGKFILIAKTYLSAARVDPDSILLRSTIDSVWMRGLERVQIIITDSITAEKFGSDPRVRVFQITAEESLKALGSKFNHQKPN
ncbi:MAG: GntR family transcriptional regulator [Pyrinomonadaceae bacterium]